MIPYRARLTVFLASLLGTAPLTACTGGGGGTDTAEPELDDVACLQVDLGDDCPDEAAARGELVGDQTCESPVREVIATGALVSQEDVTPTGYDTGLSDTGAPVTRCCYEAAYEVHQNMDCAIGRPLVVGGRMVSAQAAGRCDWARAPRPELCGLSAERRAVLAERWTRAGLLEHASVPAFARVILDLTALGAPAELVARTSAALSDEVEHAELCFALASAYAGDPVGPGALPVPSRRRPSLKRLAVETFREGCVGESLAVAVAAAQLRDATDPAVRAVLERIVADEARHAELAWDTVAWAIVAGGPAVRRAVEREMLALQAPEGGEEAVARMLDEVIRPAAEALLAA